MSAETVDKNHETSQQVCNQEKPLERSETEERQVTSEVAVTCEVLLFSEIGKIFSVVILNGVKEAVECKAKRTDLFLR